MSTTLMSIDRQSSNGFEIVTVRGELDLTNAHQLAEALRTVSHSAVVLDLGGLAFVDSAGIRTIDEANRRLTEEGRKLLLVAAESSRAAWTFRVAGFADGYLLDSLAAAEAVVRS